jgi:glycosyltransferase involved in cell wall biosynthesis
MRIFRLAVVTTHPIQYMAPWYRALAREPWLELVVIYFRELVPAEQGVGFAKAFAWDVPLRDGYDSRVLGVAPGLRGVPALIGRLRAMLKEEWPDAVLVTGWNEPGLVAVYPMLRLIGLPSIVRGESNALRQRGRARRALHRVLLSLMSAAVVIGRSNRAFYLDNGVPAQRLFPGAYFVDSQRMVGMAEQHGPQRMRLRGAWGLADDAFVFCFVGKHVAYKRPLLLVEAAARARARGWPASLLFAGSGTLTDAIRERSKALGVPVVFTGFLNQTELWRAYVPADAFVLPSTDRETWGLVTNEAMLFGLPVIVSDRVGCGPDLVRDGETGLVFSGGVERLAAAMEALMADPVGARRMGRAARRLVLKEYSMPTATAGLRAALEGVCACRSCV